MELDEYGMDRQSHRKIAVSLFNHTWKLIEKTRTPFEDELMISESQASLFHWRFAGGDLEFSRGHWIISRVYSILSMPESAIYHGNKCLELCMTGNLEDFEFGFAGEALARAYYLNGHVQEYIKYREMAKGYSGKIKNPDDMKWLEINIDSIENNKKDGI